MIKTKNVYIIGIISAKTIIGTKTK